jgi:hypothetical protein
MRQSRIAPSRNAALASLAALANEINRKYVAVEARAPRLPSRPRNRAARQLNLGAALLGLSVLADSGVEHYRGSFQNRAMYVPLAVAALTAAASALGVCDRAAESDARRDLIYAAAGTTGAAGLGFHAYNILKRPGGMSWLNLFYSAPIGAPVALILAGLLGRGAERVREGRRTILGYPTADVVGGVSAVGLLGTAAEAALLHFRGAFQNPAMVLPVSIPPLAAAALTRAFLHPGRRARGLARRLLRLTAVLGFAGAGFHMYGVSRAMGGWRNWSQNVLNGPPLPAPPSFTGLALAGLAALALKRGGRHD